MRKILRSGQKNHMQVLVSRGQISKQMRGSLIGQRERTQKCINRRLLQPPTGQIPQKDRQTPSELPEIPDPQLLSTIITTPRVHQQSSNFAPATHQSPFTLLYHPPHHQALYCVTSMYEKDIDITSSCAHSFAHYSIILTSALLVSISIVLVYMLLSILTTIVSL